MAESMAIAMGAVTQQVGWVYCVLAEYALFLCSGSWETAIPGTWAHGVGVRPITILPKASEWILTS